MASFMKKGKDAQKLHKQADAEAEAKKKASENKAFRFRLPQDEEAQITFLDGALDDEGILDAVTFHEHNLKINGKWGNHYPCTQLEEPCPICEGGDSPYLVTLFTILDHRSYTDKNGKSHQHTKRLFACKRETFRRLQKIAAKRGGLAGLTIDVSRSGEKSAAVGDQFDVVEKRSIEQIAKAYGLKADDVAAFDYDKVVPYFTAKELRQLGFGIEGGGTSSGTGNKPKAQKQTAHDDDDDEPGIGGGDAAAVSGQYDEEV